jgi:hypothetical protein
MKILSTEAQAWWIALPDEIRPVRGVDGRAIASGLQSIFSFQSGPTEKGGGIEFLDGRLTRGDQTILITKIAVFSDGINVHVPTNTDDAETVLQVILAFVFEIGVRQPISEPLHFYQSTIIADFDSSMENFLPSALLGKIAKAMPIAGESQLLTIGTNFDTTEIADARWRGINPTLFRIDRRVSVPYSLNRYFCLANMRSSQHIDILEDFEKFVSTARK